MAPSTPATTQHNEQDDAHSGTAKPLPELLDHLRNYISTLPSVTGCSSSPLYLHKNCHIPESALLLALLVPHIFRPKPSDVLLATIPKSGTTWLKALLFATVHRHAFPCSRPHHPLARHSPHELVPFLEARFATDYLSSVPSDDEVFSTHLPVHLLPEEAFRCRVIYLCREPKDCFVSLVFYLNRYRARVGQDPLPWEASFEAFCNGASLNGPYWDHAIGYWEMQEKKKVLFLKYEEMVEDPVGNLRRIAEFIGRPFTEEEEREGAAEGIVRFCRFESLSGLEVNRSGAMKVPFGGLENSMFFRKGEIGDWVNHISPEMGRRLDEITESKFRGTGLS